MSGSGTHHFPTRLQPFTYEQFQQIYSQVPRLTVDLIVTTEGGVVLIKRQETSWHDMWHLPGGTVLFKERLTDAVIRIGQEELGCRVSQQQLLGYIEYPSEEVQRGFGYSVSLAFACTISSAAIDWLAWSQRHIQVFSEVPATIVAEQIPLISQVLQTTGQKTTG